MSEDVEKEYVPPFWEASLVLPSGEVLTDAFFENEATPASNDAEGKWWLEVVS